MIFAAGMGSRLNDMTREKPKALVSLMDKPMLEHLLLRLISIGIKDIIINVHHFSDKIISFVRSKNDFGINISFSIENTLLDTGGGLKRAQHFFISDEPFLVHNADVMTMLDYNKLLSQYYKTPALAMLAVRKRQTSRYLLFDEGMALCGWESVKERKKIIPVEKDKKLERFSFMGIQIISPQIFEHFPHKDKFSLIEAYLSVLEKGGRINGYDASACDWFDLGTAQRIKEAESFLKARQRPL